MLSRSGFLLFCFFFAPNLMINGLAEVWSLSVLSGNNQRTAHSSKSSMAEEDIFITCVCVCSEVKLWLGVGVWPAHPYLPSTCLYWRRQSLAEFWTGASLCGWGTPHGGPHSGGFQEWRFFRTVAVCESASAVFAPSLMMGCLWGYHGSLQT